MNESEILRKKTELNNIKKYFTNEVFENMVLDLINKYDFGYAKSSIRLNCIQIFGTILSYYHKQNEKDIKNYYSITEFSEVQIKECRKVIANDIHIVVNYKDDINILIRAFYNEVGLHFWEKMNEIAKGKINNETLNLSPKKESTTARAFFYYCLRKKGMFTVDDSRRKRHLQEIGVKHGHGKNGESFYKIFNNLSPKTLENATIKETVEMLENHFDCSDEIKKNEVIEYAKSHIK